MDFSEEIKKMVRVLHVATRPRLKEFEEMARVTMIGTLLIGAIGVVISGIFSLFDKL